MVSIEIGKLYVCSEYNLFVFPTEERAAATVGAAEGWSAAAAWGERWATAMRAAYWSKELKCHVSWIPAGQVFCVVEEMGGETHGCHQVHVIAGESALGWINVPENGWLNIKELTA